MAIAAHKLEELIHQAFPGAAVVLKDLVGDNDHYEVIIRSDLFNGKSKLAQHRMVNQALSGCLGGALHALSIKTYPIDI